MRLCEGSLGALYYYYSVYSVASPQHCAGHRIVFMLKVLEDVEVMVTTDSEDDQAGAAAGCREMETRRRSHSAINTHHLHINTHLSVAARGLTPPPPRPGHRLPNICRQGAQHPGARSQRCEGLRQETFLP